MSLEYYLLCRKQYENIIRNLNDIIEKYDLILEATSECESEINDYSILDEGYNKFFYIKKINEITNLKHLCDKKILELCNHEFVEDDIDVSPDESRHIIYCNICDYTK